MLLYASQAVARRPPQTYANDEPMATTLSTEAGAAAFGRPSGPDLETHGLQPRGRLFWNLSPAELVEHAIRRGEGELVDRGPFNAVTAPHTGRSPNDRFVVREPSSEEAVWWGKVNVPLEEDAYERLRADVVAHLEAADALYVRDMWVCADPAYRMGVRVVTPSAWHNLFAYNMFRRPTPDELPRVRPDFVVLHDPTFEADPARHGTRTGTCIALHLGRGEVLICGTRYAGEIKKSIFSMLNYVLPRRGVLAMHCSANVGPEGTALFFGLSGTGKTTLSADPERPLIGDDEHGWSEDGVFNFEGGCYAKVIHLSPEGEPDIFATTKMFGTILENVVLDADRKPRFEDASITENTRASYPIEYIANHVPEGRGGHPRNIVFLAADAYGVLPPIARLTPEQAMFHFLSGYTAKLAGTERGVTEPRATFSTCFGAPFLPLPPTVYARMLKDKIARHNVRIWLVNTGWTGGPYGEGHRMPLAYTRAMVRAALAGQLDDVPTWEEPIFGLRVPTSVPGVPTEVLRPRDTWRDPAAYDAQARRLAAMFRENFEQFAADVEDAIRAAGPRG